MLISYDLEASVLHIERDSNNEMSLGSLRQKVPTPTPLQIIGNCILDWCHNSEIHSLNFHLLDRQSNIFYI